MNANEIATQFQQDGFVIVRGAVDREGVRAIERELDWFIRTVAPKLGFGDIWYEDSPARPIKSMFRLHTHSPFFHDLMARPPLPDIMRAIFAPGEVVAEGVLYFGKPARDGSVTPMHQDNAFQCFNPPAPALTATIAIDESTTDNGALTVQRGSHKLGLLPHRQSGVQGFSRCLIEPVDPARYSIVQLCMKPGDLALHHINTIHGSGANTTDRSRRQLGVGYCSSLAVRDLEAQAKYKEALKAMDVKAKS